jgi:hypothetical protein
VPKKCRSMSDARKKNLSQGDAIAQQTQRQRA